MLPRIAGPAVVALFFVLAAAPRADAQISSAELYIDINAGVSASDSPEFPFESQTFSEGPASEDIFLQSGSIPIDLNVVRGGAHARTDGHITYRADLSEIELRGIDLEIDSEAEIPQTALTGYDAVVQVSFQVESETTLRVAGSVSTERALDAPEISSCQWGGTILAGDTRATPLAPGTYPFDEERSAIPGEIYTVMCSAATSGGMTDHNVLRFDLIVTDPLPEPDAALGMMAAIGTLAGLRRGRQRADSSPAQSPRCCQRYPVPSQ